MAGIKVRESVSSCGEDLEKVLGRGLLNWGNQNEGFVREEISYDFLMTVADDRRVRNSGIHVVVDYVSLSKLK